MGQEGNTWTYKYSKIRARLSSSDVSRHKVPLAFSPIRAPPDLWGRIFFHITEIKQQVEEINHTDAGYTKTLPSCAFAQISRNCTGREIWIVPVSGQCFSIILKRSPKTKGLSKLLRRCQLTGLCLGLSCLVWLTRLLFVLCCLRVMWTTGLWYKQFWTLSSLLARTCYFKSLPS